MKCIIHRGSHEIGGSCVEIKTDQTRILLDMGYPLFLKGLPIERRFTEPDKDELLASGVLPDVQGLYAWQTPAFDAVVISHAHLDHYGLLPWLHPDIPVYLSAGTSTLISLSQRFGICSQYAINARTFAMYKPFLVGDFRIKPYLMDHSAFDAAAFEIQADGKTLIYSGDFRGHGRKAGCLDAFIRDATKQANVLMIEGTMLGRQQEETKSEVELEEDFLLSMKQKGPVFFQCSAQNIDRMVTIYKACVRSGRQFIVDVYTANVLYELHQLGNNIPCPSPEYAKIKVFYPEKLTQRIFDDIGKEYAKRFSFAWISRPQLQLHPEHICMQVRPSLQADLGRLPALKDGHFIYSMWQGYRDTPSQQRFEQFLQSRNIDFQHIHSSGHARVVDLERTVQALAPKKLVPIHGMFPERYADMYGAVEIRQDGEMFEV